MMLTKFIFVISLFIVGNYGFQLNDDYVSDIRSTRTGRRQVNLSKHNMALLKGVVMDTTIDMVVEQLYSLDTDDLFIFIDSPGGVVRSGLRLMNLIENLQNDGYSIHCIVENAMSMGFAILQKCTHRYILPSGFVMQHQMAGGYGHTEFNKLRNRFNASQQMELSEITREAARLNLSVKKFRSLTNDEWYLYGKNAVEAGVVDEVVTISCTQELIDTPYTIRVFTIFGPLEIVYSKCPLVKMFTSIKFERFQENGISGSCGKKQTMIEKTPIGNLEISFSECGGRLTPFNARIINDNGFIPKPIDIQNIQQDEIKIDW